MGNCSGVIHGSSHQTLTLNTNTNTSSSSSSSAGLSKASGSSVGSSSGGSSCTIVSSSWNDLSAFLQSSNSSSALQCFSYNDLKIATRGFRPNSFVGEGGFGSVFKGWIHEELMKSSRYGTGMTVAVKKLNPHSLQGHKEWMTEVLFLGQLLHPNLVKLIGYCSEDDQKLLVYEYMSRGSLDNHLFRRGESLPWSIRMKVIVGAARGLAFLHEASVIYRDFKSPNILLDAEYNAKLSDFGLAKGGPTGNKSHVTTLVMGTHGYAAPEYLASGHLTINSDIYSFGVVLLEILTGRRAIDKNRTIGEQNLVDWARPYLNNKKKLHQIIDPKLEIQVPFKLAVKVANLTSNCLCLNGKARPQMKEVLEALESLETSKKSGYHEPKNGASQMSPRRRDVAGSE